MVSRRRRTFFQSFTASIVTIAIVGVGVFSCIPPRQAKALLGVGDVTFTQQTVDIPGVIRDILTEIAEVAFSALKKAALQWITKKIQNSILGIDDAGGPGFIEDFGKYLFELADVGLGQTLSDLFGTDLCKLPQFINPNIGSLIKVNLGLKGLGLAASGKGRVDPLQPSTHPMCKLSTIVGNISTLWNSATQTVATAGHQAWTNWSKIIEPNGNEFGVYFATSLTLMDKENQFNAQQAVKSIANQGYTGKTDPKTGKVLVPGKLGADVVSETFSSPISGITLAQDAKQLAAAVFSAALVRLLNEGFGAAGLNVKLSPSQVQGGVTNTINDIQSSASGDKLPTIDSL